MVVSLRRRVLIFGCQFEAAGEDMLVSVFQNIPNRSHTNNLRWYVYNACVNYSIMLRFCVLVFFRFQFSIFSLFYNFSSLLSSSSYLLAFPFFPF